MKVIKSSDHGGFIDSFNVLPPFKIQLLLPNHSKCSALLLFGHTLKRKCLDKLILLYDQVQEVLTLLNEVLLSNYFTK